MTVDATSSLPSLFLLPLPSRPLSPPPSDVNAHMQMALLLRDALRLRHRFQVGGIYLGSWDQLSLNFRLDDGDAHRVHAAGVSSDSLQRDTRDAALCPVRTSKDSEPSPSQRQEFTVN